MLSSDGQDLFRSDDPAFFISGSMPQDVARVQIFARTEALTCELDLRASGDRIAELTASGSDAKTVSGIFHELVRELEGKQTSGSWIARHVDNYLVTMALALIASLAVYSFFNVTLNLTQKYVPGFSGSTTYTVINAIGWSCISVTLVGGGIVLQARVKALFPVVQFSGRLTAPYAKQRRAIAAIFLLIFVPIVVNVFSNFITDLLKLWTVG